MKKLLQLLISILNLSNSYGLGLLLIVFIVITLYVI